METISFFFPLFSLFSSPQAESLSGLLQDQVFPQWVSPTAGVVPWLCQPRAEGWTVGMWLVSQQKGLQKCWDSWCWSRPHGPAQGPVLLRDRPPPDQGFQEMTLSPVQALNDPKANGAPEH